MTVVGLEEVTDLDHVLAGGTPLFGDEASRAAAIVSSPSFSVTMRLLLGGFATMATLSLAFGLSGSPLIVRSDHVAARPPSSPIYIARKAALPELTEGLLEATWRSAADLLSKSGGDSVSLLSSAGERLDAWRSRLDVSRFDLNEDVDENGS